CAASEPPVNSETNSRFRCPLEMARAADRPLTYVQALRWLREEAGLSLKGVSDKVGARRLPKSTVHYMTTIAMEPNKTSLRARQGLVEMLVRACGRPTSEVQAWGAEWRRLKLELKLSNEKTQRISPVTPSSPPRTTTTKPPELAESPAENVDSIITGPRSK